MERTFRRMENSPSARNAFVEAEVATALAHQIRIIRLQRNWSQTDLAKRLGTTQTAVSRLEDPSYGRVSIKTLLELSAVFDVALNVRFESFTRFFQRTWRPKREDLEVEAFNEEKELVGFVEAPTDGYFPATIPELASPRYVAKSISGKQLGTFPLFIGSQGPALETGFHGLKETVPSRDSLSFHTLFVNDQPSEPIPNQEK